ncbi:hypothetical protein TWF481_001633 [Arthrobotrys musiformis]|uniref:RNB domain-containing protein n=1 Tax=Arthrobotrys musiformis TaxID=47236 RepID=A0AAV9VWP1_9PEZI
MSLQCPRCAFVAAIRASRPRQLPLHNRLILPTIPHRTFTTTLPLTRSGASKKKWESQKEIKRVQAREEVDRIVQQLTNLEPGEPLVLHEDQSKYLRLVDKHFEENDMAVPRYRVKYLRRERVEFTEFTKLTPPDEPLDDPYDDHYGAAMSTGGGGGDRPNPLYSVPPTLEDEGPRKMIYENQGSDFSERRPRPRGAQERKTVLTDEIYMREPPRPAHLRPKPKSDPPPPIHENQVSTPTMREKLQNEWLERENKHKVAFKAPTNVDLVLEKLIDNASWHAESEEEAANTNSGAGSGYDDVYDIDPETYASRNTDLTPGSLVEVKYMESSVPFLGVYLKNKTGNYSREAFVLTPVGSIMEAHADMSRFTLNDFIPAEQVEELLKSVQETGRLNANLTQEITKLVREFKAKVHVRYPTFNAKMDQLHTALLSGEGEGGEEGGKPKEVTTTEVARRMTGLEEPSKEDRYAAHLALLARRDLFSVTEGWESETTWEIKSLDRVERAKKIEKLIRESIADRDSEGGKMMQAFLEKARKIIDFSRKARKQRKGVEEMGEEIGVQWTDEEMELLKALEEALEYRRGQSVTLKSLYPHILGSLNRYDNARLLDEQRLFEFLGEVGVCSPWEDSILRERELGLPGHRAGVDSEEDGRLYDTIEKEEGSVEKLGLKDIMEGLRHDWGDMPVYCIDDAGTRDIDDGISLEEIPDSKDVWLHIHVANPTAFLPLDHWISKIAAKRTETFYAPARNYSMVPLRLTVEKLGLAPNRPAMTFSVRLDGETGDQKETKIRASTLRNVKRVTYAYMDKLVGTKITPTVYLSNKPLPEKQEELEPDVDEKDLETLKKFYKLGWELFQCRVRKGCMEVSKQANIDITVDNEHGNAIHPGLSKKPVLDVYEPTITLKFSDMSRSKETFSAGSAVREAMTVAGEAAAIWSNQRGMMQMYRQHAFNWPNEAEEKKWFELLNKAKGADGIIPVDFWKLYFPVGGSKLSPRMERHTALGLDGYVKVTSPLRRFADFVSHHIIQRQLLAEHEDYNGNDKEDLKKPLLTEEEMTNYCNDIKQREQILKSADKAVIRLWGIRLLKQLWEMEDPRLPRDVDVEIISVAKHPSPASGEIKELGISGARVYMPSNIAKEVKYGDVVKARLSPWHWSTDSNNAQIVALEYSDFVKTAGDVRKEFFKRIGEGVRWEQV